MKINIFVIMFSVICLLSCETCGNKENIIIVDNNNYTESYLINEEGTVGILKEYDTSKNIEIIIARLPNDNNEDVSRYPLVLFKGEDNKSYYIYPRELGTELWRLFGCLVKFSVIVHDEPQPEGGAIRITPVRWEIIEGSLIVQEHITLNFDFGIFNYYLINEEGTEGTLKDYDNTEETKIIIGRIPRYGGRGPLYPFAVITDENRKTYFIYSNDLGRVLLGLSDRLVKFTVIFHNELVNDKIIEKVTPVGWEILEGPPVVRTNWDQYFKIIY